MVPNPMSIIQRVYWVLDETKDSDWPMGTSVLLFRKPKMFEYWLLAQKTTVIFVAPKWNGRKYERLAPFATILEMKKGVWEEVFNWEDGVRKILTESGLPEDV